MLFPILLVATTFLAHLTVTSTPVTTSTEQFQCPNQCISDKELTDVDLQRNHKYKFEIKHEISSAVEGNQTGGHVLKGTAIISGGAACTYALKLADLEVIEVWPDGTKVFLENTTAILERGLTYFGYEDGKVTGFCPSMKEDPFAWNIKAAILSHLQIGLNSLYMTSEAIEEDVSGKCITRFEVVNVTESSVTFTKHKSTAGCSNKYDYITFFTGVSDHTPRMSSRSKMVDGTQNCQVEFDLKKVVSKSACNETIVIKSFGDIHWERLNSINVTTKLEIISSDILSPLTDEETDTYVHTKLAHHVNYVRDITEKAVIKEEALKLFNNLANETFTPGAQDFFTLVRYISQSSQEELEIIKSFISNKNTLKFIFEAAIYAQNPESMELLKNRLNETNFKFSTAHISLLPNPSLPFIMKTKELLRVFDSKAYKIVISNLLQTYCKSHPNCEMENDVKDILQSFERELNNNCSYSNSNGMDQVITSLRAIGNVGFVSNFSTVVQVLSKCLKPHPERDVYIRASTAEAFRTFKQDPVIDDILLKILMDENDDVEVRIHAYLSWARNLSRKKLNILPFLRAEPNQQVKSFILSHLREIRSSNDQSKGDVSLLLVNSPRNLTDLLNEYNFNPFKLSFYKEHFFSNFQYGGGVEISAIYGPQNPLPRYLNLNFTLSALGHSLNVLEVGYRSVHSNGLNRYIYGPNLPSVNNNRVTVFPDIRQQLDNHGLLESRSKLFVRLFNREISYYDDIERIDQFGRLFETRPAFIGMNETVLFPTVGGMTVQFGQILTICQDVTYYDGSKATYGITVVLDALQSFTVALNTFEGALGYSTDDKWEVNARLLLKLDVKDQIPEMSWIKAGLQGIDPNVTVFKTSRSVRTFLPRDKSAVISSKNVQETIATTPAILYPLLGLRAQLNSFRHQESGLITGYSLKVDRFDGLLVLFQKQNQNFSNILQSMRIEFRPFRQETQNTSIDEAYFTFAYHRKPTTTGSTTEIFAKMPWSSIYKCSISHDSRGFFAGELVLGNWKANISGELRPTIPNGYEVSVELLSKEMSISIKQESINGTQHIETTGSASGHLPLSFRSNTVFETLRHLKHYNELHLPSRNSSFYWDAELLWTPQNYQCSSELRANQRDFWSEWKAAFSAVNNIGDATHSPTTLLYNYSLSSALIQKQPSLKQESLHDWRIGSTAINTSERSSSWGISSRHWINTHVAEVMFGRSVIFRDPPITNYELAATLKKDDVTLLTTSMQLLKQSSAVMEGTVNASLRNDLFCDGGLGRLKLVFQTQLTKHSLGGDLLCGDKSIYKINVETDLRKSKWQLHISSVNGTEWKSESYFIQYLANNKFSRQENATISSGSGETYKSDSELSIDFNSYEVFYHYSIKRTDNQILGLIKVFTKPGNLLSLPKFRFLFKLPTESNNVSITSEFNVDLLPEHYLFDVKALLELGNLTRGVELFFNNVLHESGESRIATNFSIFGLTKHLPVTINLDFQRNSKYYTHASLFARSHHLDEIVLKGTTIIEKEHLMGDLSFLCSVRPGSPSKSFSGLLYKTQITWAFTDEVFKVEQQGEWNGNRPTPPGMPFRYGIKHTFRTESEDGEIHVYGEDTHMGKATGYELFEVLSGYSLGKPTESSWTLENNILINWRRFLGRGVVGSHMSLKSQIDKSFNDGSMDFIWILPDENQTEVEMTMKFIADAEKFTLSSHSSIGEDQLHESRMIVNYLERAYKVDFDAKFRPLSLIAQFRGQFFAFPSIDVDMELIKNEKPLCVAKLVFVNDREPKFTLLLLAPSITSNGFRKLDLNIESPFKLAEMGISNFSFRSHFETDPIVANHNVYLRIAKSEEQLAEFSLHVNDSTGLVHRVECRWQFKRSYPDLLPIFIINATLESVRLLHGPISVSLKHIAETERAESEETKFNFNDHHDYHLAWDEQKNWNLTLKNTMPKWPNFTDFGSSVHFHRDRKTSFELSVDDKHKVSFDVHQDAASQGTMTLKCTINDENVFEIHGRSSLIRHQDGFLLTLNSRMSTDGSISSSMRFKLHNLPNHRAIDMALYAVLKSLGHHSFKLKADMNNLRNLLLAEGRNDNVPIKSYLLQIDGHEIGLEFTDSRFCVFSFSLPSLSNPVVFRFAYDIRLTRWRSLLQVHQPIKFEVRGVLGSLSEAFLMVSNRVAIPDAFENFQLIDLLNIYDREFIDVACNATPSDGTVIILGTNFSTEIPQQRLHFSVLLPRAGLIESILVDVDVLNIFPSKLNIVSRGREAGIALWTETELKEYITEFAWNHRRSGFLQFIRGDNCVAMKNLKGRVDLGFQNSTFYIKSIDFDSGVIKSYLEVTPKGNHEVLMKSILLKESILLVYEANFTQKIWRLYQSEYKNNSAILSELSFIDESINQTHKRNVVSFKRKGRSVEIESLLNYSEGKQLMNSTIKVDGINGSLIFERIPGWLLYVNCNNNTIFKFEGEFSPDMIIGNFLLRYQEGKLKALANFRVSRDPVDVFVGLQTARAEAVMEVKASSLFDIAGTLLHSHEFNQNVLDSKVMTRFDEDSSLYHFTSFLRSGALPQILIGGFDSIALRGMQVFKEELEETVISLIAEELEDMKDLIFDNSSLREFWVSIAHTLQDLEASMNVSPNEQNNTANCSLVEHVKRFLVLIIDTLEQLNEASKKIDIFGRFDHIQFKKHFQSLESWRRIFVTRVQNTADYFMNSTRPYIQHLVQNLTNKTQTIQQAVNCAFNMIGEAYDEISKFISDLSYLKKYVLERLSELQQLTLLVRDYYDSLSRPRIRLLPDSFENSQLNSELYEGNSFEANQSDLVINASFYIPPCVRSTIGLTLAVWNGYPLHKTSKTERALSALFPALKEIGKHLIAKRPQQMHCECPTFASIFLERYGKTRVVQFDAKVVNIRPHVDSVLLLAIDAAEKEFALTVSFSMAEAHFSYHTGQHTFSISERGTVSIGEDESSSDKIDYVAPANVTIKRSPQHWQIQDSSRDLSFNFYRSEKMLRFCAGTRWYRRLLGAFGTPGFKMQNDAPDDFLRYWDTSKSQPEEWSLRLDDI